jgi:hypothetical protein
VAQTAQQRDKYLRDRYGIGLDDYQAILAYQGGCCAVCRRPPVKQALHVDHDHVTKRVRGLLCYDCNHRVVGRQRDPEKLRAAARYLERPPADTALLAT